MITPPSRLQANTYSKRCLSPKVPGSLKLFGSWILNSVSYFTMCHAWPAFPPYYFRECSDLGNLLPVNMRRTTFSCRMLYIHILAVCIYPLPLHPRMQNARPNPMMAWCFVTCGLQCFWVCIPALPVIIMETAIPFVGGMGITSDLWEFVSTCLDCMVISKFILYPRENDSKF